jgi:hypothetical protein
MLTCIGQARDLLLRSISTDVYGGGGTWINSPTAAIATADRRYIWSRIVCPGPQPRGCALTPGLIVLCGPR